MLPPHQHHLLFQGSDWPPLSLPLFGPFPDKFRIAWQKILVNFPLLLAKSGVLWYDEINKET